MRAAVLVATVLLLLAGCAGLADAGRSGALVPPAGSTPESRGRDITECLSIARQGGGSALGADEREQLRGRSTIGFVREGRPCVGDGMVPTSNRSLLVSSLSYGPASVTDRYVVLLLARGYQWPAE